jgi:hypothetical protein
VAKFLDYVKDMTSGSLKKFVIHEKQYTKSPIIERNEVNKSVSAMYDISSEDWSQNIVDLGGNNDMSSIKPARNSVAFRLKRKLKMLLVSYLA